MSGHFHKRACISECKAFSDDSTKRSTEISAMYESVLTGAAPSAANQFNCSTNSVITKCYGTSFNAADALTGSSTGSVLDNIQMIYATEVMPRNLPPFF